MTEYKILLTHVVLSALRYFVVYSRGFICDKSLKAKGEVELFGFFRPDRNVLCASSSLVMPAWLLGITRGKAIIIYLRVEHLTLDICGKDDLARPTLMEHG